MMDKGHSDNPICMRCVFMHRPGQAEPKAELPAEVATGEDISQKSPFTFEKYRNLSLTQVLISQPVTQRTSKPLPERHRSAPLLPFVKRSLSSTMPPCDPLKLPYRISSVHTLRSSDPACDSDCDTARMSHSVADSTSLSAKSVSQQW